MTFEEFKILVEEVTEFEVEPEDVNCWNLVIKF